MKIFDGKRGDNVRFRLTMKNIRLLVLLGVALAIFSYIKRPWFHTIKLESPHYICYSTATEEQTRQILDVAEALYFSYTSFFEAEPIQADQKYKLKLYKDREEFKSYNRLSGWAEAFYRKPYCHQYYSNEEENPYHWMVHEAVHQLNHEATHFKLEKWLNEGLAEYFGTSTFQDGRFTLGKADSNTYPIWWLGSLKLSGDIEKDVLAAQIIPLRAILTDKGGPDIDKYFNLYYIHWWSLTHFLVHYKDGCYREEIFDLIHDGGTLEAFEKHIGSVQEIQTQWYPYLQELAQKY